MNLEVREYKKWGEWYDIQCTRKKTEIKITMKGY